MAAASSAPDLSRVIELTCKASELLVKGHDARAAEKYEQAADAAQAALPGAEHCLILASLRMHQARALESGARAPWRQSAQNADALACAYGTLLPATMTALEARRAAGTLLPGCCRPAELAWATACLRHDVQLRSRRAGDDLEDLVPRSAQFMGYEAYATTATVALWALEDLHKHRSAAAAQHAERIVAFVVRALELVLQPRGSLDIGFAGESFLIKEMSTLMRNGGGDIAECYRPLVAPWRRVQASGVLQQRRVSYVAAQTRARCAASRAAAEAEASAHGLRACALPSCGAREAHVSHFKLCAACKTVAYCGKAHQAEDWARHKAACKAARAAAAASAAAEE
jgi:hypothetical protein